jgi:hypothetical protein
MSASNNNDRADFDATIAPNDGHKWSDEIKELANKRAQEIHSQRTPERIARNQMLAALYKLEEEQEIRITIKL